uniref:NADH dehydrogenase subunit 4L n=1 Tax=Goniodes dissimilis TaxID=186210 RepID=A0A9E9IYM5_9NEOP|nr:NADH dehydrogenase subunit 4L [Goniodes dissimilis]
MSFSMISMIVGLTKLLSSNSMIAVLMSLELMLISSILLLITKTWVIVNLHFMTTLLVLGVIEGVLGLSLVTLMVSNSSMSVMGITSTFI